MEKESLHKLVTETDIDYLSYRIQSMSYMSRTDGQEGLWPHILHRLASNGSNGSMSMTYPAVMKMVLFFSRDPMILADPVYRK